MKFKFEAQGGCTKGERDAPAPPVWFMKIEYGCMSPGHPVRRSAMGFPSPCIHAR